VLASAPPIAFVPSTDLDRSRRFYVDKLELALTETTPFALVLQTGNATMLRVARVDQLQVQPFTVFGWAVSDIAATVSGLANHGIACVRYEGMEQDDAGVWTTPAGDKIAWFRDPDGNTLSLTQFAT
jgi:catechol 2,3-dioxygenase-like lactoylglutathione lyase family enzyme